MTQEAISSSDRRFEMLIAGCYLECGLDESKDKDSDTEGCGFIHL